MGPCRSGASQTAGAVPVALSEWSTARRSDAHLWVIAICAMMLSTRSCGGRALFTAGLGFSRPSRRTARRPFMMGLFRQVPVRLPGRPARRKLVSSQPGGDAAAASASSSMNPRLSGRSRAVGFGWGGLTRCCSCSRWTASARAGGKSWAPSPCSMARRGAGAWVTGCSTTRPELPGRFGVIWVVLAALDPGRDHQAQPQRRAPEAPQAVFRALKDRAERPVTIRHHPAAGTDAATW